MNLDGQTLARATSGTLLIDGPAGPVCTDTRSLSAGDWFLALKGPRFDGHAYLDQARAAGATGCVVSELPMDWQGGIVQVADTTCALQDLGRYVRSNFSGPVIGVTGSSGKTTTRSLIALAIAELGAVHQTQGNLNNHLGVPMSLLATPDAAQAVVLELGTSSPGEIALLADIARPTVRIIVNVGPAHLEELGGLTGVAKEKGALFASAQPGDLLVANADDALVMAIARPAGCRLITYGASSEADLRLVRCAVRGEDLRTDLVVSSPVGELSLTLPVPGEHVAHNAVGALAVAWGLGLDLRRASRRLQSYAPVGMRLRQEELFPGVMAINDAYNANPASMEAALRTLSSLPRRRVAVLGDMLELGPDESRWHAEIAHLAGALSLDLVVLIGERMQGAAAHCVGVQCWSAADGLLLVERLRSWLRPGDTVLFKGSRGARVERTLQALRESPARTAGEV